MAESQNDNTVFDILISGQKVGEAFDVNPVYIENDTICKEYLLRLKDQLPLTESELKLLDSCLTVVSANDDDNVPFGLGEIFSLGNLAETYPSHAKEILACSHHISESIDYEGDLPDGIFLSLACAHAALGDLFQSGLKAGPIENYQNDDDDDDEDGDFDITDSDEEFL